MKSHKRLIHVLLCFLLSSFFVLHAKSIEQLKLAIEAEKNDSIKAQLFIELSQHGGQEANAQLQALTEALTLAQKREADYLQALCYSTLANFYLNNKSDYNTSLAYFLKALKICENRKINNLKGKVYIGLAGLYLKRDDFDAAEKYYLLGLEIKEKEGNLNELGNTYNNIGNFYNDKSDFDLALGYYQKSLAIRLKQKDTLSIAVCYDNIANVYSAIGSSKQSLKDYITAEEFYKKALTNFMLIGDKLELAICYINLSEFYFEKAELFHSGDDISKAIENCEKGLLLSSQIGFKEGQAACYGNLSQIFEWKGNYKESLNYYKRFKETSDSITNLESSKHIAELQTVYDVEKKDQQIKLQSAEINTQKILRNSFISGFILVLVFSFFIYRSYTQKKKVNIQLNNAKQIIEAKNKSITDSINYAQRIQDAILPSKNSFQHVVPESFILYKPKDIVSGDFYWFHSMKIELQGAMKEFVVVASADCTGHGVPGAFMSVIGTNLLGEIVRGKGLHRPGEILTHLNEDVRIALKQNEQGSATNDGMDMALCTINKTDSILEYSGANRPLYIFRRTHESYVFEEIKASKFPVGGSQFSAASVNYVNHIVPFAAGDSFYLFSDGYCDQFGGEHDKKFMSKKFRELLLSIQALPMSEQARILDESIENWMGEQEQSDDILIIGLRL